MKSKPMKASVIKKAKTAKKRKEEGKPYRQFIEIEPGVFQSTDEVMKELEAKGEFEDKTWPTELDV